MSRVRAEHPYDFFTRGSQIRTNAEAVKRRAWVYTPQYDAQSFRVSPEVQGWLDTEFAQEVSHHGA